MINKDKSKHCHLCTLIKDTNSSKETIFHKLYGSSQIKHNNFFIQFNGLYIYPDPYPITHGHTLIVPSEHLLSFIHVKDYSDTSNSIQTLNKQFGHNYILFEHGTGKVNHKTITCGNSIIHAHLHFIPIYSNSKQIDYKKMAEDFSAGKNTFIILTGIKQDNLAKIYSIVEQIVGNYPYVLLYESKTQKLATGVGKGNPSIKSQYLREMVAIHLYGNNAFWDWKTQHQHASIQTTLTKRIAYWITRINSNKIIS